MDTVLLQVENLTKHFRGLIAVNDLSFYVKKREITGLVGPNGAGKTTTFNLITGFHNPTKGEVIFNGLDITGKKASSVAALGIGRTFQPNFLFDDEICLENVVIAHHLQRKSNPLGMFVSTASSRAEEEKIRCHSEEILELTGLIKVKDQLAGSLPQGLKRTLGIALALATDPKILLLDEPVAGMSHDETEKMKDLINNLTNEGLSILLVEHNMRFVMDICTKVIVLNFGNKLAEGQPDEIRNNEDVIYAYLGSKGNAREAA